MNLKILATLGKIGYLPASGTITSFIVIPLSYFLNKFKLIYFLIFYFSLFIISIQSIRNKCSETNCVDPKEIVIDEVLGALIAFYGFYTAKEIFISFLIFRFFDILKIWPLNKLEKIPGPLGVILDDMAAGIIANLITIASLHYV